MMIGYSDHAKVSSIRYEHPSLSGMGVSYVPKGLWSPRINAKNIAYQSLFQPFDLEQYIYPRPPIDMGLIEEEDYDGNINVLRMPLKFPGTDYRIPSEIAGVMPLLTRAAEYEAYINPQHDQCFCYITFDRSDVPAGKYHRYPGFHGDGVQGTKITPKVNVEHSYILVTDPGTEFCLQPFFLTHLDEAKHNFFLELDKQARESNVYGSLPGHLYLIDPYMVHRTPALSKAVRRTFIRITYAFTELQHPKNTVNPMFSGQEYDKYHDIRERLVRNKFPIPLHLYGLSSVQQG